MLNDNLQWVDKFNASHTSSARNITTKNTPINKKISALENLECGCKIYTYMDGMILTISCKRSHSKRTKYKCKVEGCNFIGIKKKLNSHKWDHSK